MSGRTVGSFRLGALLGRGAMGEVYEAAHVDSDEPAAVKLLSPDVREDPIYLARFLREVQVAASLTSPHVVRVLEVGNETAEVPYLAMERLRGRDLGALLRVRARLDPDEVADLVTQLARGADAAADAGIVHRDLKPQNLFRAEGGKARVWKILDFGVSKLADRGGTLTQGRMVGTPAYMPPEQALGRDVDRRADVYALAAIAYRALTGYLPFHVHGGVPAVVYAVVHSMPRRPSDLAQISTQVDDALLIGLAKDPADRFASAAELAEALAAAVEHRLPRAERERADELAGRHPWKRPER
jgi:serine/threonine-protein kinase